MTGVQTCALPISTATVDALTDILKTTKPGQQVVIDYRRKNSPAGTATVTLGAKEGRDYGYLGAALLDAPWAPFSIDFNLANIGGPSAGLMFSLAVVDKLTDGELNGGKFVAGTGTITPDGKVGPITRELQTHFLNAARGLDDDAVVMAARGARVGGGAAPSAVGVDERAAGENAPSATGTRPAWQIRFEYSAGLQRGRPLDAVPDANAIRSRGQRGRGEP